MTRLLLSVAAWALAAQATLAVPSVEVIDFGIDDVFGDPNLLVQIVTDEPAETMAVELAVEWQGLRLDTTLLPHAVVEPFTAPILTQNPFTGTETAGLWIEPLTNNSGRLVASFESTEAIGIGTFDFLTAEYWETDRGTIGISGLVTVDGVSSAVYYMGGPIEPPIIRPDLDRDGDVDITDFGFFADAFNSVAGDANYQVRADFEPDGDVDITDFGNFADAFGYPFSVAVPEPSGGLLALSGVSLAALRQRSKS